ncbi:MAG: carbohydrate-binding family 9-like protein [Lentisphaeria bacterium]
MHLSRSILFGRLLAGVLAGELPMALTLQAAEPALPPAPVVAKRIPESCDLRTLTPAMRAAAHWQELSVSFPPRARNPAERETYQRALGYPYPDDQMNRKSFAAALYNGHGLFLLFRLEDSDVQGNKTQDNDWLWVEDVAEVLLANGENPAVPDVELQVNPAGTTFSNRQGDAAVTVPEKITNTLNFQTAVRVQGTLNQAATGDTGWEADVFIPWQSLAEAGILAQGFTPVSGARAGTIKLCSWDLSTYFLTRVNRCLPPANLAIHDRRNFNPLVLE